MARTALIAISAAALAAAGAITAIPAATAQAQKVDINVDLIMNGAVCGASYRLGDGRKLDFRINSENFNVDIAVQNLPADVVNAGADKENVPITIVVNDDWRTTADRGIYRAGITYRAMAYWTDNAKGLEMLDRLADVDTISVELDGQKYGPATSKPSPDFGFLYIRNCLRKNGVEI
ncbi:MAG: hypothetical protein GVX90_00810 [Alphaproteobacteria bacterium]|jgi:hypothetical protein|nr:hypothetical protein [Alphaproteobacteria bacterium]